ncbi:MAG: hypothetical protein RLZZ161_51, partial [Bacteroidota bacterium]
KDLPSFGKEYRRIMKEITELKTNVDETLGKLNAVEPTYRRIAGPVEDFAETVH